MDRQTDFDSNSMIQQSQMLTKNQESC